MREVLYWKKREEETCGLYFVSVSECIVGTEGDGAHFADEIIFLLVFLFGVVFFLVLFSRRRERDVSYIKDTLWSAEWSAYNRLSRMPIDLLTCSHTQKVLALPVLGRRG